MSVASTELVPGDLGHFCQYYYMFFSKASLETEDRSVLVYPSGPNQSAVTNIAQVCPQTLQHPQLWQTLQMQHTVEQVVEPAVVAVVPDCVCVLLCISLWLGRC